MPRKTKKTLLSPAMVMEDLMGAWRTRSLVAGVELNVFSHIEAGKQTVKEIAAAAGASPRGMASLLDALAAMGYLRKTGRRYGLRRVSATFLLPGGKDYQGAIAHSLPLTWDSWKNLTEAVRSGRPAQSVDVAEKGKEFFPKLVASIFPGNFAASSAAVSRFPEKERRKIHKILDVAAGSGAWSLAFARAIPQARITTVDFCEMTPIIREYAEKFGVAARYAYLEGDLRQADFGRHLYDLVILGHIIHSEGEKHGKELLAKCYAALRPGGKLLIAEYVPNDTRTGPAMPVLFGLNMLLQTEEGNVFTLREYRTWLKAAGFGKVTTVPVPPPSTVILAAK
jgi:2-polyprenyl-3-methyl-5-hydroxy-6-metoxy-1,4-benzoquinol methylase